MLLLWVGGTLLLWWLALDCWPASHSPPPHPPFPSSPSPHRSKRIAGQGLDPALYEKKPPAAAAANDISWIPELKPDDLAQRWVGGWVSEAEQLGAPVQCWVGSKGWVRNRGGRRSHQHHTTTQLW